MLYMHKVIHLQDELVQELSYKTSKGAILYLQQLCWLLLIPDTYPNQLKRVEWGEDPARGTDPQMDNQQST